MPRIRRATQDVLAEIERTAGPKARANASRLVHLASELGAQPRPRSESVALRMGQVRKSV